MVKKEGEAEKKICSQLYSASDKKYYEINDNDAEVTTVDKDVKTSYTVIAINKKTNKLMKKKYSEEDFKKLCEMTSKLDKFKIN